VIGENWEENSQIGKNMLKSSRMKKRKWKMEK